MKTYLVQWDFSKAQPSKIRECFGPRNEGFKVQAKSVDDAKKLCTFEHNLNPWYVKITDLDAVLETPLSFNKSI